MSRTLRNARTDRARRAPYNPLAVKYETNRQVMEFFREWAKKRAPKKPTKDVSWN